MAPETQTVKYAYRAYPTDEQTAWLAGAFGAARVVYNDYLWQKDRVHQGLQSKIVPLDRFGHLPTDKLWMKLYPQKCMEQARRQADTAYKNFFSGLSGQRANKPGKPRFKKRKTGGSLTWNGAGLKVRKLSQRWATVRLPKQGSWLRFRLSRELPSKPTGVTLKLLPSGEYQLSFTVKQTIAAPKASGTAAGVDFGLIDLINVVQDDGTRYKVTAPRVYRRAERKLARLQKELSRKKKASKNREKARIALAKQHQKVSRQRLDQAKKLAFKLCSENQTVVLEDLRVKGLIKTRLAKSFSDAGVGQLKSCIQEAGVKLGTEVLLVEPAYTSQTCSVCGVIDGPKSLNIRAWACPSCGVQLDRDYNAAVNVLLLAVGQTESLNDCGGSVRRQLAAATPSEAGTSFY